MFDQLYSAFSPSLSENMSGFLRGNSCCTALLKLTEDWRFALDDKKNVAVVAIDLSKAFALPQFAVGKIKVVWRR